MIRFLLFIPALLGLGASAAMAQGLTQPSDAAASGTPLRVAIAHYHAVQGKQASLYSGTEYVDYMFQTEGHPYFLTNHWTDGAIVYDGMLYEGVPMLYDIVNEAVIISVPGQSQGLLKKVRLNLDFVGSFKFEEQQFVRLAQDCTAAGMPAGFYSLLYDGDTKVFAKRAKTTKKDVAALVYYEEDKLFVFLYGKYHLVKNKSSALKVFSSHKKELSRFLWDQGIDFKDNREQAIISMAAQYDALRRQ